MSVICRAVDFQIFIQFNYIKDKVLKLFKKIQSSSTKIIASRREQSKAIATAEPFKVVDLSLGHFTFQRN